MAFTSILFLQGGARQMTEPPEAQDFIADLNLEKVFDAVVQGRAEYDLRPYFLSPLPDIESISYRHEVFRDLERQDVSSCIRSFAQAMRVMRSHLTQTRKLHYERQKQRWFLDAVLVYCDAVAALTLGLEKARVSSRGLAAFADHLRRHVDSESFTELRGKAAMLSEDLAKIAYCVIVNGPTVTVRRYADEEDYSAEVERTFARFKETAARSYRSQFQEWVEMDHVEANILDYVAKLFPQVFDRLAAFFSTHRDFVDESIATFDREIQFYLAFLDFIEPLRRAGLSFCYPEISTSDNPIFARDAFDVALAQKLNGLGVVCNDWQMTGSTRIFVVSGPNQGGKTTFARAFGQMHYLGKVGCPVPGRAARLLHYDSLHTHFERQESVATRTGKLEDDLLRMRAILEHASERSIILINEMLSSTTLRDGIQLGARIMEKIRQLGAVCIWVTFIEELAKDSEVVVSLVGQVDADNPAERTYRIEPRPPGGLAYALSLVQRHGLTYEALKERIPS